MRVIAKTELGSNVLDRQNTIGRPSTSEEAEERWDGFGKKKVVRNKLKSEQKGLCAYTEFNISAFVSLASSTQYGCHIEHIKPKSRFPNETFDYENLVVSVLDAHDLHSIKQGELFVITQDPDDESHLNYFGGHAKFYFYDANLFISPTDPDCEHFFAFLEESGAIIPSPDLDDSEQEKARYTIELLNLNHPYLKNQRRQRIEEVVNVLDSLDSTEAMAAVIELETTEYEAGQIASFPSAIKSLIQGA
jgi:uncharacterized protein (TIGR02646 family)